MSDGQNISTVSCTRTVCILNSSLWIVVLLLQVQLCYFFYYKYAEVQFYTIFVLFVLQVQLLQCYFLSVYMYIFSISSTTTKYNVHDVVMH